ncbi:MAG TPA: hypothetical protein VGN61_07980, partial [Verrucomicrobiae bacterium]
MSKNLARLIVLAVFTAIAGSVSAFPIYDPFNYTQNQPLWGQTDANGDYWWEIDSGQVNPPHAILTTGVD